MYERLIFATEIERASTRQLLGDAFPLSKLWYVADDTDFLMDMEVNISEETFFRYMATTLGPARLLLYSCFNLSMAMHDPPIWLVHALRHVCYQLPSGEAK
jgi:hypothetical protein